VPPPLAGCGGGARPRRRGEQADLGAQLRRANKGRLSEHGEVVCEPRGARTAGRRCRRRLELRKKKRSQQKPKTNTYASALARAAGGCVGGGERGAGVPPPSSPLECIFGHIPFSKR